MVGVIKNKAETSRRETVNYDPVTEITEIIPQGINKNHRVRLVRGDITKVRAWAIVSPDDEALGTRIKTAAGESLPKALERRIPGGMEDGDSCVTGSYNLRQQTDSINAIFHVVGPVRAPTESKAEASAKLEKIYKRILELMVEKRTWSIAIPPISVGKGYSEREAAEVAW